MANYICNPLNLEYRYQFKDSPLNRAVYREAADPTMVVFRGHYLLFASMSGGFWYSDDLKNWTYKATPELPVYDYAPDVREVNGKVVFCASRRGEKCGIYQSADPIREPFTLVSQPLTFWDPDIFQDDDGRVYLYWGCDTRQPIWGIELDARTMLPIGKKTAVIRADEENHGWERIGENNKVEPPKTFGDKLIRFALGAKPCIEGAFMTKYDGRYYLQYATPGTEHNVYSDGVYVGDSPLGPFVYQSHNPFSGKPGGFITAAGHGSTFRDLKGRWWHISTMRISDNDNYERRVGLFPCGFDGDGLLYCNQNFADFPLDLEAENRMNAMPEQMLLSYGAKVTVSSCQEGFGGEYAADENIRTHWAAKTASPEEWLRMDLGEVKTVSSVQVNFADHKLRLPQIPKKEMVKENIGYRKIYLEKQRTACLLEGSQDGEGWEVLKDTRADDTDCPHDFIELPEAKKLRYLRLSHMEVPMGGAIAVSGLRVFGRGNGAAPAKSNNVQAKKQGRLNLLVNWDRAENAIGYNIRYGIAPGKLYSSWQVYEKTELDIGMINADRDYYLAVDSFNENGITMGDVIFVPGKEK